MKATARARWNVALLTALVAASAGCSNPVSPEPHQRPTGFDLVMDGETLVAESDGALTGSLTVLVGQPIPVTVRFLDGTNVITPGSDYFLAIEVANPALAAFSPTQPGAFSGTLLGVAPGATTVRVRLMHGRIGSPRAHHDFQSAPVPLTVVALPAASGAEAGH